MTGDSNCRTLHNTSKLRPKAWFYLLTSIKQYDSLLKASQQTAPTTCDEIQIVEMYPDKRFTLPHTIMRQLKMTDASLFAVNTVSVMDPANTRQHTV